MSALRARCPRCTTLTAVALDGGYECHVCGAAFASALVRVPRAWGAGGDAMAGAARLPLDRPEAAVVERDSLEDQHASVAANLPERPLVLGGCCCAHVGAIRGLAARHGRIAVVWLDAHGDLNTPESSPSGDAWGMPLRSAIDEGTVAVADVALLFARNLDPPETAFLQASGIDDDLDRATEGAAGVYVALDLDALAPGELAVFMPEPGGPGVEAVIALLERLRDGPVPLVGLGLTGLRPEADVGLLERLAAAAGL
ncbi:MAG: arginase family protein [Gaiella sp.]